MAAVLLASIPYGYYPASDLIKGLCSKDMRLVHAWVAGSSHLMRVCVHYLQLAHAPWSSCVLRARAPRAACRPAPARSGSTAPGAPAARAAAAGAPPTAPPSARLPAQGPRTPAPATPARRPRPSCSAAAPRPHAACTSGPQGPGAPATRHATVRLCRPLLVSQHEALTGVRIWTTFRRHTHGSSSEP